MKTSEIEEKVLWTPTPDWVQSNNWIEKEHSPFSGQVLKYEKQVHIPKKTRYISRTCRLDSYDDVQHNSVLNIEFDPSYQRLHLHKLEVYRGEQKTKIIPRYKHKIVQQENESHLYIFSGIWTSILIIDDLRIGDILEYSFSYEGINAHYGNQILENFYLDNTFPIKHVFCRIIAESDRVSFKNHNHENQPHINTLEDGLSEWIWDLHDQKQTSIESSLPSWFDPFSWVQVTSFSSWEEVSSAATIIFPTQSEPIPEIMAKIDQWKAQNFSLETLILDIIHFVQNEIHYLSLRDDMNSGQAADPNEVFMRRYGDCKDKSGLLCLLLNLIGIPTFPALVNSRNKHKVANWLPSPYAFNHAIVGFSFEGSTYWVDPTYSFKVSKISQFPIPELGYALPIGNSNLIALQENPNGKVSTTVQFELKKGSPTATMSVITSFQGVEAVYFRRFLKTKKTDELQKFYTEYYKSFYKEIIRKEDIKITDNHDENTILLSESYEIPNFGTFNNQDNILIYHFNPLSLYEKLPKDIDDLSRKFPIELYYPLDIEERITIKSKDKLSISFIDTKIENAYLSYQLRSYKQDKHNLVIAHSLKALKDHIPAKDLAEVQRHVDEIFKTSALTLQLIYKRKKRMARLLFWLFVIIIILLKNLLLR